MTDKLKKRIKIFALIGLTGLLLAGWLQLYFSLSRINGDLAARNTVLSQANAEAATRLDKISSHLLVLSDDFNDLRENFGLSRREYPLNQAAAQSDHDSRQESRTALFFKAIEKIESKARQDEKARAFGETLNQTSFTALTRPFGLTVKQTADTRGELQKRGKTYFNIHASGDQKLKIIAFYAGEQIEIAPADDSLTPFLEKNIPVVEQYYRQLESNRLRLANLARQPELAELLKQKTLRLEAPQKIAESYQVNLKNSEGNVVLRAKLSSLNGEWQLAGQTYKKYTDFYLALIQAAEKIDSRGAAEKKAQEGHEELLALNSDPGFIAYLKQKNLILTTESRQDAYYLYYDLIDKSGDTAGSLAIQKLTGDFYLMDKDDVPLGSFKSLTLQQEEAKKKLEIPDSIPRYQGLFEDSHTQTILLMGGNEGNSDTMIVVHLDQFSQSIGMVSIPRDLYYKGRKINSYYSIFGPRVAMQTISEITGLKITHYLYIDMFAFIDAIDVLGGVDIVLEQPLIDPSYTVKINGRLSTLYYEAGTHHLDGVAALRIVRSRNTSSDFARSRRQQKLLSALKKKLADLGSGDAGAVLSLIQVIVQYVRTDLGIMDLYSLYTNNKSSRIYQNQLTTANVLRSTYTNIYQLSEEEQREADEEEDFFAGQYILLPRNDDWNLIRWYIRKGLAGGQGA